MYFDEEKRTIQSYSAKSVPFNGENAFYLAIVNNCPQMFKL